MEDQEQSVGTTGSANHDTHKESSSHTHHPVLNAAAVGSYRFLSSYTHTVDSKSRMVIPQVYRNALGNDFVIAPSLDFECVALYPRPIWSEEINKLLLKSRKSTSDAGWALEQFSTLSYENCDVDSQGRVLIPSRIKKQYLGEAKEVVVMGKMTHVLIKSQEKAAEHDRQFMENKADILKRLDMIEV